MDSILGIDGQDTKYSRGEPRCKVQFPEEGFVSRGVGSSSVPIFFVYWWVDDDGTWRWWCGGGEQFTFVQSNPSEIKC